MNIKVPTKVRNNQLGIQFLSQSQKHILDHTLQLPSMLCAVNTVYIENYQVD